MTAATDTWCPPAGGARTGRLLGVIAAALVRELMRTGGAHTHQLACHLQDVLGVTHQHPVHACNAHMYRLAEFGWVRRTGGRAHAIGWVLTDAARAAIAAHGLELLPTRPDERPPGPTSARPASAAPALAVVPPARHQPMRAPVWRPPAWQIARAGAQDFLAVPTRGIEARGGAA